MSDSTLREISEFKSQPDPMNRTKHEGQLAAADIALYIDRAEVPIILRDVRDASLGRAGGSALQPTVDLTNFGAYEKGVSRNHATIRRSAEGKLTLTDLGSANGTYMNTNMLEPHHPYPIKSGDVFRLANLTIQVFTAENAKPATPLPPAPVTAALPNVPLLPAITETGRLNAKAHPPILRDYTATVTIAAETGEKSVQEILEKILKPMMGAPGTTVTLKLHIHATSLIGFRQEVMENVRKQAVTLKFDTSDFR